MSYSPARVDKNTNNVWKWKRNSDNVVVVVPSHMWKSADKWSEDEISSLFDGTVAAPPAPVVTSMPTPEVEYAPSDDDDEDENFNPNVNDEDDEEESTPAVTTTATI